METKSIEPNIINGVMMFIILIVVFMALLSTKIRTTNRIKLVIITKKDIMLKDGNLSNIAPTILELLGINKPNKMTSESLIIK